MIAWIDVNDSTRVAAIAYDADKQTTYVRFKNDGVEWWYGNCSQSAWEQFSAPGTSKGRFIHQELDSHPNGQLD